MMVKILSDSFSLSPFFCSEYSTSSNLYFNAEFLMRELVRVYPTIKLGLGELFLKNFARLSFDLTRHHILQQVKELPTLLLAMSP